MLVTVGGFDPDFVLEQSVDAIIYLCDSVTRVRADEAHSRFFENFVAARGSEKAVRDTEARLKMLGTSREATTTRTVDDLLREGRIG